MTAKKPRPPAHLKPPTKAWFAAVVRAYELEPHHVRLLQLAGESWDRCEDAREILARDGLTCVDDRRNVRAHPAVAIEKDARTAFARLIRELDLDAEAPRSNRTGPPGLRSNAGRV